MKKVGVKKIVLLVSALAIAWVIGVSGSMSEVQAQPKTCATEYPKHRTSVPSDYPYDSEDAAFRVLVDEYRNFTLRKEASRARATSGPCEETGWHTKVRANYKRSGRDAFYPASLVGCPICKDTSSGPELYEKWGIR